MKFGVREICDVVLKAKNTQRVGNKIFYPGEPIIYFDTLKTSSMEGASTTVYAQGGRGNARLVAWEGDRTLTFTMEDALISPEGFMILSGAGLVEATKDFTLKQHMTETVDASMVKIGVNDGKTLITDLSIPLSHEPYLGDKIQGSADKLSTSQNYAYIMFVKDGEIISEPFIPTHTVAEKDVETGKYMLSLPIQMSAHDVYDNLTDDEKDDPDRALNNDQFHITGQDGDYDINLDYFKSIAKVDQRGVVQKYFDSVIIDYYFERSSNAKQVEITADKFGGYYYLEASTLFRNQKGADLPAEFIIPNCKIQSNFNFAMASSGDPSTFTFTMDAFPDYTKFDHSKKVLAAIQLISEGSSMDLHRHRTDHEEAHDQYFTI